MSQDEVLPLNIVNGKALTDVSKIASSILQPSLFMGQSHTPKIGGLA